jgi:hypothetical protein
VVRKVTQKEGLFDKAVRPGVYKQVNYLVLGFERPREQAREERGCGPRSEMWYRIQQEMESAG